MRKAVFWVVVGVLILGSVAAWASLSSRGPAGHSVPDETPLITNAI
jgi:hypothetical protein